MSQPVPTASSSTTADTMSLFTATTDIAAAVGLLAQREHLGWHEGSRARGVPAGVGLCPQQRVHIELELLAVAVLRVRGVLRVLRLCVSRLLKELLLMLV